MSRPSAALLLLPVFWAACSSSEPSATPESLAAASAVTLTSTVGTAVAPLPAVTVTSSKGGGFAGATVTFAASGGTVTGATATTDASGKATVGNWQLGPTAGTYTLTATVNGLQPVTFTATATAGAPASITVVSGGAQTAPVASPVPTPIRVQVKDQYGNLVANASVTFAVTTGGGQLAATSGTTASNGEVTLPAWTLGTTLGANTVSVTAGSATATVTATGQAGAPVDLIVAGGSGQEGDIGTPLGTALSAKVTDNYGNGVAGVAVTFAVVSGPVQVATTSATTNAQGLATTMATLTAAGAGTVQAASTGLGTVTFAVSTGPTISGQVTQAPLYLPPSIRSAAGASAPSNSARADALLRTPTLRGAVQQGAEARNSGAVFSDRRLVVRFRAADFGLPTQAVAYQNGSLALRRATTSYVTALAPHVQAQRVVTRALSAPLAAALIEIPEGVSPAVATAELLKDPRIASVAPDAVRFLHDEGSVEASPVAMLAASWGHRRAGTGELMAERYAGDPNAADQLWHYRMIDAMRVWPTTTGSAAVRVGVIDSGLRRGHPAVQGIFSAEHAFDFVDGLSVAYSYAPLCAGGSLVYGRGLPEHASVARNLGEDPMQYEPNSSRTCYVPSTAGSHGTHVAATIASRANDGVGGTGVNWNATIVPIRTFGVTGGAFGFDIAQSVLYAAGLCATYVGAPTDTCIQMPAVDVVNMSFGGTCDGTIDEDAITLVASSVLMIASMGNSSSSLPQCPAALPNVVAVSALGPSWGKAYYTNTGSHTAVSAPGGDVSFTPSHGVFSATWNYASNVANYSFYQGTSMAAPHVTGVAALIKAANPGMTTAQLRERLISGAVDRGTPGHDAIYGHGVVNAYRSVTGNAAPPQVTRVWAIDAASGAVVRTVTVAPNGSYHMTRLPVGTYRVVGGQDEDADGRMGVPGRRFGMVAGTVTVSAQEPKTANFSIGEYVEVEPNNSIGQAHPLVVESSVRGTVNAFDLADVYVVRIPTAGEYTFETSGVLGACGLADEANTILKLLDATGSMLASNDDTPYPMATYPGTLCSRIVQTLSPGTYYLEVTASKAGQYRLHVAAVRPT